MLAVSLELRLAHKSNEQVTPKELMSQTCLACLELGRLSIGVGKTISKMISYHEGAKPQFCRLQWPKQEHFACFNGENKKTLSQEGPPDPSCTALQTVIHAWPPMCSDSGQK